MPRRIAKSLVTELQLLASSGDTPVSQVAMKALVIASKLHTEDFEQWLKLELNGYIGAEVPPYRILACQFKAWNPVAGEVPTILQGEVAKTLTTRRLLSPLGELEALTAARPGDDSGLLKVLFPAEVGDRLRRMSGKSDEVYQVITVSAVKGILSSVRTRILEWTLDLEKRGLAAHPAVVVQRKNGNRPGTEVIDDQFERRYRIWSLLVPILVALIGGVATIAAAVVGRMSSVPVGCQAIQHRPPPGPGPPPLTLGLAATALVTLLAWAVVRLLRRRAAARRAKTRPATP